MKKHHHIQKNFLQKLKDVLFGNYTFLLVSLISLFVLFPFVDMSSEILLGILLTFILLASIYTIISSKKFLYVGTTLIFLSIIANWLSVSFPDVFIIKIAYLIQPIFFVYICIVIVTNLFSIEDVTMDIIMGSICVYLFIGLAFSMFYEFLHYLNHNAFNFIHQDIDPSSEFFYFSYVTLTTLGYGDITPNTQIAKSVSVMEAIIGQFYLAIMVARLVALQLSNTMNKKYKQKS